MKLKWTIAFLFILILIEDSFRVSVETRMDNDIHNLNIYTYNLRNSIIPSAFKGVERATTTTR